MSSSLAIMMMGMQAAGTALDFYGNLQQKELGRLGEKVNQAEIGANIEAAKATAAEASLQEMRALRENLSSQFATQVARGTNPSAGSAMFVAQKSRQVASEDERARRLNLEAKITSLHASSFLSQLHQTSSEIRSTSALAGRVFQSLPTQAGIEKFRRSETGRKLGFGFEKADV